MKELNNLVMMLDQNIKYKGKDADGNVIFEITPGFDVRQCLKRIFDAIGTITKEEKKAEPVDILVQLSDLAVPMHDLKSLKMDGLELEFFETVCKLEETALDPVEFMPADMYKDYTESIKKSVEEDFEKKTKGIIHAEDPDYGKGENS